MVDISPSPWRESRGEGEVLIKDEGLALRGRAHLSFVEAFAVAQTWGLLYRRLAVGRPSEPGA